jgi:hypothetical protein
MPSLADSQSALRHALVTGDVAVVAPFLVSGPAGETRFEIHRRHYVASLATTLLGRFPATAWLVGDGFLAEAAREFVQAHPPTSPCLAEYAEDFPQFLATRSLQGRVPYLRSFAELDWALGFVSVAIDHPSIAAAALASVDPGVLPDVGLTLQPGVRYLRAEWPVDELINLYLADSAPDRLAFDPEEVRLEVLGARGEFHIRRLDRGSFVFRQQTRAGRSIGPAAECALEADRRFDPAMALATLFADGLVVEVTR